ncbi:MAG TPA: helix-turn-helix domain-containing protein [Acidimicrobiales bacterium]|nr:helix-turn-helix domain-containing protein [Acidimicrobiales bacterium]
MRSNEHARAPVISLREEQKRLTRRRLLDSAHEVFSAKGYVAATVDDIVAGAGASRATFYLHFSSKLEILFEVSAAVTDETAEYYATLDEALAEGSRASLEAAIDGIIGWFEEHSGLMQAWGEAAMVEPEVARKARHRVEEFFDAMPYLRSSWPKARQEQARLRLSLFLMQLERFFQRLAVMGEWDAPRKVLVEVLADVWSEGFLPASSSAAPARKRALRRPASAAV